MKNITFASKSELSNRPLIAACPGCLLATLLSTPAYAQSLQPNLWIGDDQTRLIYQTTTDGTMLSSFPVVRTLDGRTAASFSPSGIDIDPVDGTLWVAGENPGRVVHFSRSGQQLEPQLLIDREIEGVAVAIDPGDASLWVVTDPVDPTAPDEVLNVDRADGTVNFSFDLDGFRPRLTSPQEIDVDPFDGTLWISNNAIDGVFNVSRSGEQLGFVPHPEVRSDFGRANLQGVSVSSVDGTLWLTDREMRKIYHVTTEGELLGSFPTSTYDINSMNAASIAFEAGLLGGAGGLTTLALPGAELKLEKDSLLDGDAGVGPGADYKLKDSVVSGALLVDPGAGAGKIDNTVIRGGPVEADLWQAAADAERAAELAETLPATQVYDEIKRSMTISGGPGLNVLAVRKIQLKNAATLTLSGGPTAEFIVNVEEELKVEKGSAIVLQGGLLPEQVLFNLLGGQLKVKDHSFAAGIFLAPDNELKVEKDSVLFGALISGEEIKMKDGVDVIGAE